jgi:tripartite-type tricarboxylate transporter receptor subunit TctC
MRLGRRRFLRLAAAAAFPASTWSAAAQAWPSKPVRIIVGFSAGGSTDIVARIIGQWLSERLGQPFLIENRTGASSNIATEAVVNAPADGYTLLMAGTVNAVNATLYDKLNFVFLRDLAPVGSVLRVPQTLDVNPSVPARTIPELIAFAKANPDKLNMGSGGIGTPQHVAGELFMMMTGTNMVHVPYRGGAPAVADLLAGQVQVMFDVMPESIGFIRAGKLRTLAVTTAAHVPALPEIPTVSEFVPGYETSDWFGLCAPKGTPAGIIGTLNRELNAALADAGIRERFAEIGGTVLGGSPSEFAKLLADETGKWAAVIRFAGIKAD